MILNRRNVGALMGGGITITLATIGGLKIQDTIDWNNKVSYFEKVSAKFASKSKEYFSGEDDWYLPKWENKIAWEKKYLTELIESNGKENKHFKEKHPTSEKFRDFCFEQAQKENECNAGTGSWCSYCARKRTWDTQPNT